MDLGRVKCLLSKNFGDVTYLYLEKDGEPLVAETERHSEIKVGDTVKVGFPAGRCQLFDSQTAFNNRSY